MSEPANSATLGMLHAPWTGVADAWYDYTSATGMAKNGNLVSSG